MGLGRALTGTTLVVTILKVCIGGLRPYFFTVCRLRVPDHPQMVKPFFLSAMDCMGDPAKVKEAQMSFPSGHTASAFAGFGFLALFLAAKFKVFGPSRRSGMPRRKASGAVSAVKVDTSCTRTIKNEIIWCEGRPRRFGDMIWTLEEDPLPEETQEAACRPRHIQFWKLLLFFAPWIIAAELGWSKVQDG